MPNTAPNIYRTALTLFLLALAYNSLTLTSLEFFRHTEADRTLIAWEMLERGNFWIPHLLGDPYLSKPPLFYFIVAITFKILGSSAEWSARLPSALAASFLTSLQYLFLRGAKQDHKTALLSALILSTTALYFSLSVLAEIDMLFCLFCSSALFAAYLGQQTGRRKFIALSYALLFAAVLTKGLPALVFYYLGLASYQILTLRNVRNSKDLKPIFLSHVLGSLTLLVLVALCSWQLIESIGWSDFVLYFNREIWGRFSGASQPPDRVKHLFYYLPALFSGLLPWSFIFFLAICRRHDFKASISSLPEICKFAICVIVPNVLLFSLASGKASRYLFPLYPFFCLLFAHYLNRLASLKNLIMAIVCFGFIARFGYWGIYSTQRNDSRSVKEIVEKINNIVPDNHTIYTLEMFERWVCYYLKRKGKHILRLTPQIARELRDSDKNIYLLLSSKDELWRLEQIKEIDFDASVLASLEQAKTRVKLVRMAADKAIELKPHRIFPTVPSERY